MHIEFTAQGHWGHEPLATRVNDVINGSLDRVTKVGEAENEKWMLGTHNDWWLRIGADRRCLITTRGGQTREQMEALAVILRWRVGLPDARVVS